jgi:hypothetical protein
MYTPPPLSLSLSLSSILSVFQPTPNKVYIYLHLASSSSQPNTTTNIFLCQDFSLNSFFFLFSFLCWLLFSRISVFCSTVRSRVS